MKNILVGYATTEGHTRKICNRVAERLTTAGRQVELVDLGSDHSCQPGDYEAVILAGSLHQTKHQTSLVDFASRHAATLGRVPSAFLSVSLSAAGKMQKDHEDAQSCVDEFIHQTGWQPNRTLCVAGALKYTQYDFLKRYLMKMISKAHGGDTDTSHDVEYTDWDQLNQFVDEFVAE